MKGFGVAAILLLIVTAFVSIVRVDSGRVPAHFTGKVEDVVDSPSTQTESVRKARDLEDLFSSLPKTPSIFKKKRRTSMGKAEVTSSFENRKKFSTPPPPKDLSLPSFARDLLNTMRPEKSKAE